MGYTSSLGNLSDIQAGHLAEITIHCGWFVRPTPHKLSLLSWLPKDEMSMFMYK